jgi:hypothetical protein
MLRPNSKIKSHRKELLHNQKRLLFKDFWGAIANIANIFTFAKII